MRPSGTCASCGSDRRHFGPRCPSSLDDFGCTVPDDPFVPTLTAVSESLHASHPRICLVWGPPAFSIQSGPWEAPSSESGWSRSYPALKLPLPLPSRSRPGADWGVGGPFSYKCGSPRKGMCSVEKGGPAWDATSLGGGTREEALGGESAGPHQLCHSPAL